MDEVANRSHYYFIGIGGAGMSAIAGVLLSMGHRVSGSDIKESRYTKILSKKGADIHIGHREENISCRNTNTNLPDYVVYSSAISNQNCEMIKASELGLTIKKRAEVLAELTRNIADRNKELSKGKFIAVAGTHGKTTITSMTSFVLSKCGIEPTYFIGAELNEIGANSNYGSGNISVAETDESDGSLMYMDPDIVILSNMEPDHLDFYDSYEQIEEIFKKFLNKLPVRDGLAVLCGDFENIRTISKKIKCKKIFYGLDEKNDIYAKDIELHGLSSSYTLVNNGQDIVRVKLKVPGVHNICNSLGVIGSTLSLGIDIDSICKALLKYSGVKRRFEIIDHIDDISIVSDYAHHPSEVDVTINAAKATQKWNRIITVFQPHRYSRTKHMHNEFGKSFEMADVVILTDVYGAGEDPIPGVSGKLLTDSVLYNNPRKEVIYLPKKSDIISFLSEKLIPGDLLLIMGAGDIPIVADDICCNLRSSLI